MTPSEMRVILRKVLVDHPKIVTPEGFCRAANKACPFNRFPDNENDSAFWISEVKKILVQRFGWEDTLRVRVTTKVPKEELPFKANRNTLMPSMTQWAKEHGVL